MSLPAGLNKKKSKILVFLLFSFQLMTIFSNINFGNPIISAGATSTDPAIINFQKISINKGESKTIYLTTQFNYTSVEIAIYLKDVTLPKYIKMEFYEQFYENYTWRYTLDSKNFFGEEMYVGKYNLIFRTTLADGNITTHEIPNAIEIVEPTVDVGFPPIYYLIIGGIVIAVVVIVIIKRRAEYEYIEIPDEPVKPAPKRKREVYYGASKIGRLDGKAADALVAKRRAAKSQVKVIDNPAAKLGISSKSSTSARNGVLPDNLKIQMEEKKVDSSIKMEFIDSKLDALNNQIGILKTILSLRKEPIKCPNCNNVMGEDWEICPFCKIEEHGDIPIPQPDKNKMRRTICKDCGNIIEPIWEQCPTCLVQHHTNQ